MAAILFRPQCVSASTYSSVGSELHAACVCWCSWPTGETHLTKWRARRDIILFVIVLLFIVMVTVMYKSIVFQLKNNDVLLSLNVLLAWCHVQPGSQSYNFCFSDFTEFKYSPISNISRYFLHFDMETDTLYGDLIRQIWHRSAEISAVKFEVEYLQPELFPSVYDLTMTLFC